MEQGHLRAHFWQKLLIAMITICAAFIFTGGTPVYAAEWYDSYIYEKNDTAKTITLTSSKGSLGTSAIVPGSTTINGVAYKTILDNSGNNGKSLWSEDASTLTSLTIQSGVKATAGSKALFAELSKLTTLDVSGLDTSDMTDMSHMFFKCFYVKDIDVSNFNTAKVTKMEYMFYDCSDLLYLDLANFNTTNVTSMVYMFSGCSDLIYIDLSSFNTEKTSDMTDMFAGSFGSTMLQDLDLRSFNLNKGSSSFDHFVDGGFVNLYLPEKCYKNFNMTDNNIFKNSNLKRIYYAGSESQWAALNNTYDSSIEIIYNYTQVNSPVEPKVSNPNTTTWYNNYNFYLDKKNYKLIIMSSKGTGMTSADVPAYTSIGGKTYKTVLNSEYARRSTSTTLWANDLSTLKQLSIAEGVEVADASSGLFRGLTLNSIDVSALTTTNVVDMSRWFNGVIVKSLDLRSMDMSSAKTANMFLNASITDLYLPVNAMKKYSLSGITGLTNVYYAGTETEWKALGNSLGSASITYNYKGSSAATTVKVTFDGNGGGTPSPSTKDVTYESDYGTLPTVARSGYSFAGWYTEKTGGTQVTPTTKVANNAAHTLYAHWTTEDVLVTVSLNSNGGNSVTPDSIEVSVGGSYGTLPTPTRTGYVFDGWFTAVTGGVEVTSSSTVSSSEAHTLYAHWTKEAPTTVTVTFNANGGAMPTGASASVTLNIGGTYGTLPTPARDGYSFDGWYTTASGGTKVSNGTTVTNTNPHTLYAMWTKVSTEITVTLNANGGSVSTGSITATTGQIYGTLPQPTRDGYTFNGWYTEVTGGTEVIWSTDVTATTSHTLYAHWTANTFSVTFNANGGSVSPSSKQYTVDSTYDNMPIPTREGYDFDGWYTDSNGGDLVNESDVITKTTSHTLFAHWTAKAITVTFNSNGGSITVGDESKTVTVNDTYGTLPTAERTGYNFKGWFDKASGGTQITAASKVSTKTAHTLYAQWTEIKVTVTFSANGGSVTTPSKTMTVGQAYGTLPTPTRTGYKFDGWFTDITGGTQITNTSTVSIEEAHTLYAHWTITTVTVTFSGNGDGSTVSKTSTTATIGGTYGTLPTAKRTDYDFLGWFTAAEGGDQVTSTTKVTKTTAHTLYAHWQKTVITMKVTFNANGGSITEGEAQRTVTYDSKYGDLPKVSRTGYTFTGWYTAATGGDVVTAEDTVNKKTAHALYAQWKQSVVTVLLNANGGTVSKQSIEVTYDNVYGELPKPADREDYTFDGWYTSENGNTEVKSSTKVTQTATHTLYAHWTKNIITVTVAFSATGGTVDTTSKSVTYNDDYGTLPTPTKEGYDFVDWYTDVIGGKKVTESTQVTTKTSHTLYAHWSEKYVTVNFDVNADDANITSGTSSNSVSVVRQYGTLPVAVRSGYTFDGWYTGKTGGTQVTEATSVISGETHTLYAQWTPVNTDSDKVTVTLDPNGGVLETTSIKATKGAEYGVLPVPVKTGYTFDGWTSDGTLVTATTKVKTADHKLIAHWTEEIIKVNVTYNANGGTVTKTEKEVVFGQTYGTLLTPARDGYTFDGWYTAAENGEKVTSETTVESPNDHSIFAHWIENKKEITITFNTQGGTVDTLSKTIIYGEAYGTLPKPTKENSIFKGWFTDAENGTEVTSTTSVTNAVAHELYAHWQDKVLVSFNANEGAVDIDSKWVTVNEAYGELPEATRADYTFEGWYTDAEAGTEITDVSTVSMTESHTLFAHWTENIKVVTVTFNVNEGVISDASQISKEVTVGKTYGDLPTATREGYEFKGWYTDAESGEEITSSKNVTINTSHTLYARWTEKNKTITVTFNANGGNVSKATAEYSVGEYYSGLPTPEKEGYNFKGWYLEVSFETPISVTTKVTLETSHPLYAYWEEIDKSVAVTLNANGGTVGTTSMNFKIGDKYTGLPTPVKTGYTFDGWYTESDGGELVDSQIDVTNESSHTLYAHWTAKEKTVTVTLNANGGAVSTSSINYTVGEKYENLPIPTKTGYTFDGWYTESDAGEEVDGDVTVEKEEAHTLYAHWVGKITVTLNANGGTISVDSFQVDLGGKYSSLSSLPNPVKNGYTFEGWYTETVEGTKVTSDTEVTIKTAHTIYAHWSGEGSTEVLDDEITVALNANGGTVNPESMVVTTGEAYGALPTPQRDGYTFLGWHNEEGEEITKDTVVEDKYAHTLYAYWEESDIYVTVSFNANGGKTSVGTRTVKFGEQYGNLPSASRAGYTFRGWYTEVAEGEKVYDSKEVTIKYSHTVYAHWIRQTEEVPVKVNFDANGGTVGETSREVIAGNKYGDLPEPTRADMFFDGWYTEVEGGILITADSEVDTYSEHTLYAHWTSEKKPDPVNTNTDSQNQGETPLDPASQPGVTDPSAGTDVPVPVIPEVNTVIADPVSGGSYKVTSNDPVAPAVTYKGTDNKKAKTVTVPETVTIDGITYAVTKVDTAAFKNNKKVTKIVIGKNVTSISKNAFKNCKTIKTIVIKTTKLTKKTLAKGAFKGITKKTVIKVPKKKLSAYKKLFRSKGLSKKVKVKKG